MLRCDPELPRIEGRLSSKRRGKKSTETLIGKNLHLKNMPNGRQRNWKKRRVKMQEDRRMMESKVVRETVARKGLMKIMKLSDEEIRGFLKDADELEKLGDYSSAQEIYDRLVLDMPNNPKLCAFKGYCYYLNKQYDEALLAFDKAIEIKSDVPSTLYYRAKTYEKLGRLRDALIDYELSVKLSPEIDAFINIAMLNKYFGNLAASKSALLKAESLEPENHIVKKLLEIVNDGCGNVSEQETPEIPE